MPLVLSDTNVIWNFFTTMITVTIILAKTNMSCIFATIIVKKVLNDLDFY